MKLYIYYKIRLGLLRKINKREHNKIRYVTKIITLFLWFINCINKLI